MKQPTNSGTTTTRTEKCEYCYGTGKIYEDGDCVACDDTGQIKIDELACVTITDHGPKCSQCGNTDTIKMSGEMEGHISCDVCGLGSSDPLVKPKPTSTYDFPNSSINIQQAMDGSTMLETPDGRLWYLDKPTVKRLAKSLVAVI